MINEELIELKLDMIEALGEKKGKEAVKSAMTTIKIENMTPQKAQNFINWLRSTMGVPKKKKGMIKSTPKSTKYIKPTPKKVATPTPKVAKKPAKRLFQKETTTVLQPIVIYSPMPPIYTPKPKTGQKRPKKTARPRKVARPQKGRPVARKAGTTLPKRVLSPEQVAKRQKLLEARKKMAMVRKMTPAQQQQLVARRRQRGAGRPRTEAQRQAIHKARYGTKAPPVRGQRVQRQPMARPATVTPVMMRTRPAIPPSMTAQIPAGVPASVRQRLIQKRKRMALDRSPAVMHRRLSVIDNVPGDLIDNDFLGNPYGANLIASPEPTRDIPGVDDIQPRLDGIDDFSLGDIGTLMPPRPIEQPWQTAKNKLFQPGDYVITRGDHRVGQIRAIRGEMVLVSFGEYANDYQKIPMQDLAIYYGTQKELKKVEGNTVSDLSRLVGRR